MREKILIWCALCGLAGVATSCVSTQKSLYSWENYEKVSYDYSKDQTDQRLAKLDECFDKMTAKQRVLARQSLQGYLQRRHICW